MRTEPYDWFSPPGGQPAAREHQDPTPAPAAPATPSGNPYGQNGPYGQPYGPGITYGQSSAYGQANPYGGGPPTQPLPPLRQPTGEHEAQHARHAQGQHGPAQHAQHGPVRQPTGEHAVRRPTGQHSSLRPPERADAQVGREIRSHAAPGRGDGRSDGRGRGPNGHGHGHRVDLLVSRRTTNVILAILIPCAIATAVALGLLWPGRPDVPANPDIPRSYGQVQQINEEVCPADVPVLGGRQGPCGTAVVRITDGPGANLNVFIELPMGAAAPRLSVGDDVILGQLSGPAGGPDRYVFEDMQRGNDLVIMVVLCALVVVAFGRLRGLTALIGLGVSFAVLLLFILPAILGGASPLLVAIVGSAAIMFAVLYLTHGFSVHTSVAVLGTLASLVLTGLLALLFAGTTSLTGYASEEAVSVSFLNNEVDLRGLLLAGFIIGALGVLDDVTVTQATAVAELSRTATSRLALYRAATRVGRAHVASAVNTIILAYAGAALPVLLLITASGLKVSNVLSGEFLAQEIVRAAVGTMGLVAAVPITTMLAALVADLRSHRADARADDRPNGRHGPRPDSEHWAEVVAGR